MQKYIHLVQIMETEKVAANQLRTQLEDQDTEIERLKAEVCMNAHTFVCACIHKPPPHTHTPVADSCSDEAQERWYTNVSVTTGRQWCVCVFCTHTCTAKTLETPAYHAVKYVCCV